MKISLSFLLMLAPGLVAQSTAPTKSPAPVKKTTATKHRSSAAHYRQLTPTPDRYRQIQKALVDKGFLKSEPTGVWDASSTDALRQYQTANNLSPTGKLSSQTLISLGLGPKNPDEASSAVALTPAKEATPSAPAR